MEGIVTKTKPKIIAIDYAKCIGIVLIIVGHFLPKDNCLRTVIYSFHVPLFFFLAGMLYNNEKSIREVLITKTKRILFPYTYWFIISSLLYFLNGQWREIDFIKLYFFIGGTTIWNSVLWFLPVIYFNYFLSVLLLNGKSNSTSRKYAIVSSILSFLVTIIIYETQVPMTFFGIDKTIHMWGYFLLGFWFREEYAEQICNKQNKYNAIASILLFISLIIMVLINQGEMLSVLGGTYGNIYIYIPCAIIMSIAIIFMCNSFDESRWREFVSKNTIFYMCTHYFFLYFWQKLNMESTLINMCGGILTFMIITVICISLVKVVKWFKINKSSFLMLGIQID